MKIQRIPAWVLAGFLLWGLASVATTWAAPGQDMARQTVPSRTPVPGPQPEPEPKDTPVPTAAPGATVQPDVAATLVPGATLQAGVPTTLASGVALKVSVAGQPSTLPPAGAALWLVPVWIMVVGLGGIGAGRLAQRKRRQ